jgi:hypothetical protein
MSQLPSGRFEAQMCLSAFAQGRHRRLDVADSYPWLYILGEQVVVWKVTPSLSSGNHCDIGRTHGRVDFQGGMLKFNRRRGAPQGYMTLLFGSSRVIWGGRDSGTLCRLPMEIDSGTICREGYGTRHNFTGGRPKNRVRKNPADSTVVSATMCQSTTCSLSLAQVLADLHLMAFPDYANRRRSS